MLPRYSDVAVTGSLWVSLGVVFPVVVVDRRMVAECVRETVYAKVGRSRFSLHYLPLNARSKTILYLYSVVLRHRRADVHRVIPDRNGHLA